MPTACPPFTVQRADNFLVDGTRQNHLDHINCLLVSHPHTGLELAGNIEPFQHLADLGAAAMHDNRIDPALLHHHNVTGKAPGQQLVPHGMATIFDDNSASGILLHEGQRLGDGTGLEMGNILA